MADNMAYADPGKNSEFQPVAARKPIKTRPIAASNPSSSGSCIVFCVS